MHPNLSRHISAGEIIKPWLMLGPFYEDLSATVQGLTLFEKPGAEVGRTAMTQIVGDAQAIGLVGPRAAPQRAVVRIGNGAAGKEPRQGDNYHPRIIPQSGDGGREIALRPASAPLTPAARAKRAAPRRPAPPPSPPRRRRCCCRPASPCRSHPPPPRTPARRRSMCRSPRGSTG